MLALFNTAINKKNAPCRSAFAKPADTRPLIFETGIQPQFRLGQLLNASPYYIILRQKQTGSRDG